VRGSHSGTKLDLPDKGRVWNLAAQESSFRVPRWSEMWWLVPGLTVNFDPLSGPRPVMASVSKS